MKYVHLKRITMKQESNFLIDSSEASTEFVVIHSVAHNEVTAL